MPTPYKRYRKLEYTEMRPYQEGEDIGAITISDVELLKGSPKVGDMIARNPRRPGDLWLVTAEAFQKYYEEM